MYLIEWFNKIIEPNKDITDLRERQSARLVAGIFLFISLSSVVYVLIPYSHEASRGPVTLNIFLGAFGVYFGKGKWSRYAGYLIPLMQIFPITFSLYMGLAPGQVMKWFASSFLFAALFLPHLGMFLLFVVDIILAAYLSNRYGEVTFARLMENFVFLTVIFVIFFVSKLLYTKMDRERRKAERELQEAKDFVENITQSISDGLLVLNQNFIIQSINPTTCGLLGYEEQELVGLHISKVMSKKHPDLKTSGMADSFLLCKNGDYTPVSLSRSKLIKNEEYNEGEVWVIHDLSTVIEREKTEREQSEKIAYQAGMQEMNASIFHNIGNTIGHLKHLSDELDKNQQVMVQVLEFLADEIKNISVHSVQTDKDLLLEELKNSSEALQEIKDALLETNSSNQDFIRKSQKGVNHIVEIIRIQQQMSHGVAPSTYAHKPFDLVDMIYDVVEMESEMMRENEVHLELNLVENLPKALFSQNALMQVLINIFQNSIESIQERETPHEQGRLIHLSLAAKEENQFEILISDNGNGMDQETLKKIFQYGYTTKKNGNGFGLHFAANFIQQQGGAILVESDGIGQGCKISMHMNYSS